VFTEEEFPFIEFEEVRNKGSAGPELIKWVARQLRTNPKSVIYKH